MSQECFIQKSISSCWMLFFSQHFPVRPKNILVVYPKILHNLGLKHSILEPLAESHGCLFWSCSSWPFLPEQHTQCQIDSTTKGNKLIFEGLEFLFLFSIMGESVQNAWQLPLCCVPCHCIHPSKCLGNKDQRCESKRGRTQRLKMWMLQIQSKFQTDNIYVSEPPTTPSNLCKLEKKKQDMVIWWKDTPGQFVEKRTLQEGWRCSRFNRLTLPAIWHLGCMILRKLEILRKDPFARQWVTMTVTFSRSISRIVHSRINKRSNRNPNFYVSNTSLIRVRFWGQLC